MLLNMKCIFEFDPNEDEKTEDQDSVIGNEKAKGKVVFVEKIFTLAQVEWLKTYCPTITPEDSYRCYGIAVGDGTVIYFEVNQDQPELSQIVQTSLEEFQGDTAEIKFDHMVSYTYTADEVLERARINLGTDFGGFHPLTNNSEHFANWCACGKKISRQAYQLDDDQDMVEKAIDRFFEPLVELGDEIDRLCGWGDYKKNV